MIIQEILISFYKKSLYICTGNPYVHLFFEIEVSSENEDIAENENIAENEDFSNFGLVVV